MKTVISLVLILCGTALWAATPAPQDDALEARYRALTSELRCLVCQNESIADSHADLAKDLRNQVRTMLEDGKSDREITDYLVARYGDFVLFRPRFKSLTAALWLGPFILAGLGALMLIYYVVRRHRRVGDAPLTGVEQQRLRGLLQDTQGDRKG